jgi:predicted lysophospholipase L1 biosynthesis ABC-type transport system permease subunit
MSTIRRFAHTTEGVLLLIKNMGSADRIIRTIVAIVLGVLILTGEVTGMLAVILGIVAVIFLATSAMSTCPLYLPLKISTLKDPSKK